MGKTVENKKKYLKTVEFSILTSFQVYAAPKSWLKCPKDKS